MKTLKDYLNENVREESLKSVLISLENAIKGISVSVKTTSTGKAGTSNVYGEEQIALDVVSDDILTKELSENKYVAVIASEEKEDEEILHENGQYACCYDPLDGSSLFDVNLTVGTIIGVYGSKTFLGVKGDEQVAAIVAVYGPRTVIVLTVRMGTVEFTLKDGEFVMTNEKLTVDEGEMFAPGNLRACSSNEKYFELVKYWIKNEYKLRYSGGMVPDIYQILVKGKGIFSYPGYPEAPEGKLRLLFECAPMALLLEEAGGAASDGKERILEKEVEALAQRSPIFIGSKGEVLRCEEYMN